MRLLLDKLTNQPYFLLLLPPLIWSGNAIAGRLAAGEIAPFTFTALRWLILLIVLFPFVRGHVRNDWPAIQQSKGLLLSFGAVGFAGFNMLLYLSLHYTTAINATLIQAAIPMIILLISGVIFRERLQVLQLVGVLLAFIGVALIITQGDVLALFDLAVNQGDAMLLLAGLLYALYSIGLRYKPDISWLSFITVCTFGALLAALPFMVYELYTLGSVFTWSLKSIALVLYTAFFASFIAQIAFAKGVSLIGASRAGLAINLVPVFGAFFAVLLLGEVFHWFHLLALLLVLGGIALSEWSTRGKA